MRTEHRTTLLVWAVLILAGLALGGLTGCGSPKKASTTAPPPRVQSVEIPPAVVKSAPEKAAPRASADEAKTESEALRSQAAPPPPPRPMASKPEPMTASVPPPPPPSARIAPQRLQVQVTPKQPTEGEKYQEIQQNPIKLVAEHPVSTFSIDVDTGSYANVRRILNEGRMPPRDAVRVEEMINYFSYDYPVPQKDQAPFALDAEAAPCPWNPKTVLLRLGLKGYELKGDERPPVNLVFLIDVSGSMAAHNRLPLLKTAFKLLVQQLGPKDRVSMVVYAGAAGVVLEPTPGDRQAKILSALYLLKSGGSTAGGQGIQLAYTIARQAFIDGGVNRVLLATDGDFNVGTTSTKSLLELVERERKSGVALSTLGFGQGNYNEEMMERLADAGNGNYSYIDNVTEANKVLVQQLKANLVTIAQDVKIQVEFNPAVVTEYRLIGYENRLLKREDFRNDKVDAGDIGAGHTVTALYELALTGSGGERISALRYGAQKQAQGSDAELGFLKLRYKLPGAEKSRLMSPASGHRHAHR